MFLEVRGRYTSNLNRLELKAALMDHCMYCGLCRSVPGPGLGNAPQLKIRKGGVGPGRIQAQAVTMGLEQPPLKTSQTECEHIYINRLCTIS